MEKEPMVTMADEVEAKRAHEAPVATALAEVHKRVDHAAMAVQRLVERIDPILTPKSGEPNSAVVQAEPNAVRSRQAEELDHVIARLRNLVEYVDDVIQRVEV